jgi:site-specific DNA recombinase
MVTAWNRVVRAAGIYVRISAVKVEGDDLGVRRQERACRQVAERSGWPVVGVYEDNDRSAWSRAPRPDYQRLLGDIRSGRVDAVVAFGEDRLHRNSEEHIAFLRLAGETGVVVQTVTGGPLDHTTAGGKLQSKIAADLAEYESDIKSERVRSKLAELRAAGRQLGGRRPFGMTVGRAELVPAEAEAIREAAAFVVEGGKLYRIVKRWNDAGLLTVNGNRWDTGKVRSVLTANWARGLGPEGVAACWPAIIDPVTARRLDAILKDPARRLRRPEVQRHVLSGGLLCCGRCGGRMHSANTNGHRGYGCRECHRIRVRAEPIEEDLSYRLFARLDEDTVAAAVVAGTTGTASGSDDVDAEIASIEARKAEYLDMFDAGEISRAELRERRGRLDEQLVALRAEAARDAGRERQRRLQSEAFSLVERWETLDVDQRRLVFEAFMEQVTVSPAVRGRPSYDASRVKVTWRL